MDIIAHVIVVTGRKTIAARLPSARSARRSPTSAETAV
jgi:hypothetical protein